VPFKKRMGWKFKWVSSFKNDFNFDYHVSFTPEEIQTGVLFYNYAKTEMDMDERDLPIGRPLAILHSVALRS